MAFGWRKQEKDSYENGINYVEVTEEREETKIDSLFKGNREKKLIDRKSYTSGLRNISMTRILKTVIKIIVAIIVYLICFAEFTKVIGFITLIGGLILMYYLYFKSKKFKAKNMLVKILIGIILSIFILIFGIGGIAYEDYCEEYEIENIQLQSI